jgi:hypothetical protein
MNAKLFAEDRDFCDTVVKKDEVLKSLKILSNGKAPGVDGLPVESYKFFLPAIGDAYMDLLHECFGTKE